MEIDAIKTQLEIICLKGRHLRLGDTKEWRGYADLLTEDFVLDISEGGKIPVIHGRDAAVKQVRMSCDTATTVHQAHTPEFQISGDEVLATWAMHTRVVRAVDQPSFVLYGYHYDRWVRRQHEWKLAALRQTTLHLDVHPPIKT